MATLRFRGTEFRNLIDVLAQATRASAAGECPEIEVNGIVYRPHVLAARPSTYRRAGQSLAQLAQARVGK